ncbi:MAG: T9SS type A sorting domain-containing protein [Flavobacterium sp.]
MKKYLLNLVLFLSITCIAQTPGDIAQSFGNFPSFNSFVNVIATQTDGKILVGGGFTSYNGLNENYIIRLNADGSKDSSFDTGTAFNGEVLTIEQQIDGKILVGGSFTSYNGVTENRIVRLNVDGSKDSSFNTGTAFNSGVITIKQQTDGKILVGGQFSSYNGLTENKIVRLNPDGSKDTSFNTGTGFNEFVRTIQQQTDGKILIGGSFFSYKGTTENRIIRLNTDGSKDTSFNIGTGFNGSVTTIQQQTDGKILIGGSFVFYNDITENNIIRLNIDGTKDTTFNTGTGFNSAVLSIAPQADGKILVGGGFTSYNEVTENRIIRLNSDGTKDATFNTGTGLNSDVRTIYLQSDGKILIGGSFTSYKGVTENYIIRLNTESSKDTFFNNGTGFNGSVWTIHQQADGKILIGGDFTSYKGITENRIVRFNVDGSIDTSFNTETGFNGSVWTIQQQTDGKILVGGDFTSYKGIAENRIVRLNADGSKDSSFNTGTGFNSTVFTIEQQTDGKILAGGQFTSYNSATENRIIRLNTDGSKDTSFITGTGFNGTVLTIQQQTDGKILIGGSFANYNGNTSSTRIIRLNLNGNIDNSFNSGTGFTNIVNKIKIQSDGKIIVTGAFTGYNGAEENRIIRLNTDGTKDTNFNTGSGFNGQALNATIQTDGKILVGGQFTSYNGTAENRIIRLNTDGSKDSSFNTGTGFNGLVRTIKQQTDGKILVGGSFALYKGNNSSAYLIGLHSEVSLNTTGFNNTNSLVLYPNPVKNILNIKSTDFINLKGVKIFDLQGKLIIEDTNDIINVSSLSKGLYIIKVETEEGEFTKKFIKE